MADRHNWQASISIETQAGNRVATEQEARRIAEALGWEVTGPDDPEVGQWNVSVAECDMAELLRDAYIERRTQMGDGAVGVLIVDAGDSYPDDEYEPEKAILYDGTPDSGSMRGYEPEPDKDMDGTYYHNPKHDDEEER